MTYQELANARQVCYIEVDYTDERKGSPWFSDCIYATRAEALNMLKGPTIWNHMPAVKPTGRVATFVFQGIE